MKTLLTTVCLSILLLCGARADVEVSSSRFLLICIFIG